MKIAILDDYLHLSQKSAAWSKLPGCEITVFDRALKVPDEAAEVLKPFNVLSHIRERTPMPRALIERLPNLKLICITGFYHRTLDVAAANEHGVRTETLDADATAEVARYASLLLSGRYAAEYLSIGLVSD